MRTYLSLKNEHATPLPEGFSGPDVRFAEALAERFIEEFTKKGDVVFDPFAGLGTTVVVAERMGREGRGIELGPARAAYIRSRMARPERLIEGDSRRLDSYALPEIGFSLTSPPYMGRGDVEDPLAAYAHPGEGYEAYLQGLQAIYAQLGRRMRPGARAVIEASNLKREEGVTPLAWDIARSVGAVLRFEGEIVIAWEPTYGFGYDHSYALVFSRASG